ncbi:MAG TPA: ATP-binding protein [Gaiellaceae bacterium]|nr:ATP-binding protein [Gaiellaceae bacterium]
MSAATTAPVGLRESERAAWEYWIRPWAVGVAAVVVAGITAALTISGDVLVRPGWFALFAGYNVIAFAAVGLLWRRRRPASRVGLLLLLLAGLLAVVSLQGASSSLAFSIGVLFDPVSALVAWYLVLTYPASSLRRAATATFGLAVATVVVGFVPWFFLSPNVAGATPLAQCTEGCPANALMIANRPDVAGHFGTVEEIFRVLFALAFVGLLVGRLVLATRPRRRVLAPVYVVACAWITAFGFFGALRYLVVTEPRVWDTLGWFLTGTRVALPLAFVLALVLAQIYAGGSLATMMRRLQAQPAPAELERAAGEALGDPGLRLAIWRSESEDWADVDGAPIVPAAAEPGRRWRELRSAGQPVAALGYDAALEDDPELTGAVATAVVLSFDRSRTDSERQLILSELQASRRRIATASATERRRIERDLHDSAQQQLVALRIHLDRASERLGRDAELERVGEGLEQALDEIRAIAHGAYPSVLRDFGLGAALTEATRSESRARVQIGRLERYSEEVEAAVYFSALEAVQNASKHCPPGARITVEVWEDSDEIRFEVRDDGPGFDPTSAAGSGGLVGIRDRLAAAGGRLEIQSEPGHGARVRGAVPTLR